MHICELLPLSLRVYLLLAAVVVCSLCFVVRFRLFDLYLDDVVICLFVGAVDVFHCAAILAVSQYPCVVPAVLYFCAFVCALYVGAAYVMCMTV